MVSFSLLSGTGFCGGGLWVFLSHLVEDLNEGGDQAVDVTLVVHARCLQDHEGAEQLCGGSIG